MRIDSHQHFWYYNPVRESWITDDMAQIRKDFMPEDLQPLLEQNRMDGCILVQADDSEEESELLLEFSANHSFIKGVVGWVDLTDENCENRLAHFAKKEKFKGIRHTLQAEAPEFMLREDFQRGISKLSNLGLTYDLLILEKHLPAAVELVKNFPDQRFVLDHMAKPKISGDLSKNWVDGIQNLATAKNVYCKVSGFLVETEGFKWEPQNFSPFLDVVLKAFGEDRLMFGSDWPVCLAAGSYEDTANIVESFFSDRSENVCGKVMGLNAATFYRL